MSLEKDITAIKILIEQEEMVFKPASPENLAVRKEMYPPTLWHGGRNHGPSSRRFIINDFVNNNGTRSPRSVESLSIKGNVLYSYQTPIAVRKDNLIYTCNRQYSPTTSRQQGEVRVAAGDRLRDVSTAEFIKIVLEVGANYLGRLREQKLIELLNEQLRS